jgi:hypothetical protein
MREGGRAKQAWSTYAPAGSANALQGLAGNGRSALGVVALPSRAEKVDARTYWSHEKRGALVLKKQC